MKRVLVPFDFSPNARRACALAMQGFPFGNQGDGEVEVELLHVIDEELYENVLTREHLPSEDAIESYLHDELTQLEAQLAVSNGAQGELKLVRPSMSVVRGRPHLVIDEQMRASEVVGVCLGGQGHGGMRERVLGRTAQRVIRHAKVPVLVIKRGERLSLPTRMLAAVDWSDNSARALLEAARLCAGQQGVLSVLHVLDSPYVPYLRGFAHEHDASGVIDQIRAEQLDRLTTFVKQTLAKLEQQPEGLTESVVFGDPATSIAAHASSLLAELVVVGARGTADMSRYLLGSTAEKLVSGCASDILVLP